MTGRQFNEAIKLAKTPGAVSWAKQLPDGGVMIDLDIFDGCALPGAHTVVCTIEDVAKLIKYQVTQWNGEWDLNELENLRYIAKIRFQIIGDPVEERNKKRKEARLEAKWQEQQERMNAERRAAAERADAERARSLPVVLVNIQTEPETVTRRIRPLGGQS